MFFSIEACIAFVVHADICHLFGGLSKKTELLVKNIFLLFKQFAKN